MSNRILSVIYIILVLSVFCPLTVSAQSSLIKKGESGFGASLITINHDLFNGIGGEASFIWDGTFDLSLTIAETNMKKNVLGRDAAYIAFNMTFLVLKSDPDKMPLSLGLNFGIQNISFDGGSLQLRQLLFGASIYYDLKLSQNIMIQPTFKYFKSHEEYHSGGKTVLDGANLNYTIFGASLRLKASDKLYFRIFPSFEKSEGETIRAIYLGIILLS